MNNTSARTSTANPHPAGQHHHNGKLLSRIVSLAEQANEVERMDALAAGVFDQEAQELREKFDSLVQKFIMPAFIEFKTALRHVGRDAAIITRLTHKPVQSITLVLLDRYVKLDTGQTFLIVNPREDITKQLSSKFYQVYQSFDMINVRERTDPKIDPISTLVTYDDIVPIFLENELARFFDRANQAPN